VTPGYSSFLKSTLETRGVGKTHWRIKCREKRGGVTDQFTGKRNNNNSKANICRVHGMGVDSTSCFAYMDSCWENWRLMVHVAS
jgi:hypothetical protein